MVHGRLRRENGGRNGSNRATASGDIAVPPRRARANVSVHVSSGARSAARCIAGAGHTVLRSVRMTLLVASLCCRVVVAAGTHS